MYVLVLTLWSGFREKTAPAGFYILFALSVTVSVQLVGVYLVFSCLIIPALGTVWLAGEKRLIAAYAVGIVGFTTGLIGSSALDLPT